MDCLSIAHSPAIQIPSTSTVLEAVELTLPAKLGAVAVVDAGKLVGIFTERDVMLKVVHARREPAKTLVRDVMTAPVITIARYTPKSDVMSLMLKHHIRHLPISSDGGKTVLGMLSIRNLLEFLVEELSTDLRHMEAYIGADSPGG
jgi:CBS domain-containing protein